MPSTPRCTRRRTRRADASRRCSIAPIRPSLSRPAASPVRECSSPSPSASTLRSIGRPAWATACATSRRRPRSEPIRSWCSPVKARKPARPAGFRKGPPFTRIWPRWRTRCANDLSALARIPDRPDPRHPSLRDRRPHHFSFAAACTLSRDLRLVAHDDLAGEKRARYPLPRDRHGKPAADSRRDPVKASIGLGNLGLPGHFPAAGAGVEARAPVDPLLRLGACADEPDRDRPQPWSAGAESDGRARLAQGFWIAIFPEGTRVKPGERGKYHEGGAWLAVKCGAPVVPVAHNAGQFWGRNAFLKRPGTVTVEVGPPIDSRAHTPA